MKIIGKRDSGFIIDANENEVANLIGFYYTGSTGCPRLKVGDEIKVSSMFDQLNLLAKRKNALKDAAEQLRNYAKLIELTEPIIEAYIEPEENKAES